MYNMDAQWYNSSPEEVFITLGSRREGLTAAEATERLEKYGLNQLEGRKKTSPVKAFFSQFLSPLIYVLLVAVIISIVVGHYTDAWVILGVLILNAIIGFVQEAKAEKAMDALLKLAAPRAGVSRDNRRMDIPASEIVPGDIILLEAGDKVPADARLISASNLKVNESTLTGESVAVDKDVRSLPGELTVSERENMVFMGTVVTYGRATAIIIATGMSTEMGRIAVGLQEVKSDPTPLQKSTTVTTAGNPSGMADTAAATARRKISSQLIPLTRPTTTRTTLIPRNRMMIYRLSLLMLF